MEYSPRETEGGMIERMGEKGNGGGALFSRSLKYTWPRPHAERETSYSLNPHELLCGCVLGAVIPF